MHHGFKGAVSRPATCILPCTLFLILNAPFPQRELDRAMAEVAEESARLPYNGSTVQAQAPGGKRAAAKAAAQEAETAAVCAPPVDEAVRAALDSEPKVAGGRIGTLLGLGAAKYLDAACVAALVFVLSVYGARQSTASSLAPIALSVTRSQAVDSISSIEPAAPAIDPYTSHSTTFLSD